ncbi:MAG: phenylacetate--CoA ligase family protein, partial [Desulfobacterales bacterium]
MTRFQPDFGSIEALEAFQLEKLKWTVAHAYEGSPAYRIKFDQLGVRPESVQTLDDLKRLPFTTADDLRDGYPFPLRAVGFDRIVRIHSSSGTTGKRKNLCYTRQDVEDWTHFFARAFEMAGVTPSDRVQIAVGYGVWTAGVSFQAACEALGAMALPAGPGNVDLQCQFLVDLESTVLCCTASMGLLLAEEVHRRGISEQ